MIAINEVFDKRQEAIPGIFIRTAPPVNLTIITPLAYNTHTLPGGI